MILRVIPDASPDGKGQYERVGCYTTRTWGVSPLLIQIVRLMSTAVGYYLTRTWDVSLLPVQTVRRVSRVVSCAD